jgi:hypothetical protein
MYISTYLSIIFFFLVITSGVFFVISKSYKIDFKITILLLTLWVAFLILTILLCINVYIMNESFNEIHKNLNEMKFILEKI